MSIKEYPYKIRMTSSTPVMNGHMHIDVWTYNFVEKFHLKVRKHMMYNIRRRFSKNIKTWRINDE